VSAARPAPPPGASTLDRAAFEQEFPGTSGSAAECTVLLVRTAERFLGLANHGLRHHGLSVSGRQVLAVLEGAGEPIPAGAIAERLVVTTASTTTVLDTLERRGLVRRRPDHTDRRRVLVEITDDGRPLVDRYLPEIAALQAAACEPLSERERDELLDLLGRLYTHMQTVDPDAAVRAAPHRSPILARTVSTEDQQPPKDQSA
jgi:DNA-binding MarR family transcriptional regulator